MHYQVMHRAQSCSPVSLRHASKRLYNKYNTWTSTNDDLNKKITSSQGPVHGKNWVRDTEGYSHLCYRHDILSS
ncbi:Uncharacterized protein HZ326_8763 [Fusarium oxysporum f. sp. albedinis]|nr:Uncharacterized protein HZ326_8763 [Fusarium oxysporum f. sp. albedinis]